MIRKLKMKIKKNQNKKIKIKRNKKKKKNWKKRKEKEKEKKRKKEIKKSMIELFVQMCVCTLKYIFIKNIYNYKYIYIKVYREMLIENIYILIIIKNKYIQNFFPSA